MEFDFQKYGYGSRRTVSFARNGMVATSSPLPAQTGLDILRRGGNAIDAAIATAAALTVMEPTSNGIGSDAFALVWSKGRLYGLNASGVSPKKLSLETVRAMGHSDMPKRGWASVTVPGAPAAWAELSRRFGRLSFKELLEPAAQYVEEGYPLPPHVSRLWRDAFEKFSKISGGEFKGWFDTFAPDGVCPGEGELWRCSEMAATLREIAASGAESFYRGDLAHRIDAFSKESGGYIRFDDLASWRPEWVEPINTNYHGYDVFEIPPNGHGITVLMALNILSGLDLGCAKERCKVYHRMAEALKLAFTDAKKYVADPAAMRTNVSELLSMEYAAKRRALISDDIALTPEPGDPSCGGTVYLCTADGEGNMVSYIQSNYMGFGSGIVVPGTGISLQNRAANFSLDPGSDNVLAPCKRPYHTIIPGFLAKDGKAVGPFGVMGGFMQPQGHLQVLVNTIDFKMNPQEALDAPRFQWTGGKHLQLEKAVHPTIVRKLKAKGHETEVVEDSIQMGRGEIIWNLKNGVLAGASEPRCDGTVACY